MAKRGHVTGHKRERKGASDWYRDQEEANIRRVEAKWQEREAQGAHLLATNQEGKR